MPNFYVGLPATGSAYWKDAVDTFASLPVSAIDGEVRVTLDSHYGYIFNGSSWILAFALGASGDVSGPAASVDNEITLFSGTTGKIIKRATGTGVVFSTSGVFSVATLTASRALASNGSGVPVASATTATELGFLSGVTSAVQTQIDSKVAKAGDTMTGFLVLNANPVSAFQATPKQYVDALILGIRWKEPAIVATTANISIATDLENGDTIDGVTLTTGDRVLVKSQTSSNEDGIYIVPVSGAASRSLDADTAIELNGAAIFVDQGTLTGNRGYIQINTLAALSDPQSWVQNFGMSLYSADGNGIELSGSNVFSLELDGSTLSKSSSGLKVASGGITNTEVNASAAIAVSKLAALTVSRAVVTDGSGFISAATTTAAEIGFVNGVTSAIQTQLDAKQPLDSDLTALAGLSTTGVVVRTGSGTATTRTITASTGISISNGDGVAGNPTISTTITQYTDEMAQDAVGTILTDSSKIDFTYDDTANTITATIVAGSLVNADINASAAIAYSKLNLTGLIVNADINASAAIAVSKLAALTASKAVVTDASGFLTVASTTGVAHLTSGALSASNVVLTSEVTGNLPVTNGGTGTATAFTLGSVVFAGTSGVYTQDNSNFFWDNTNKRLGIGTTTPTFDLDVFRSSGIAVIRASTTDATAEAALAIRTDSGSSDKYAALELFGSSWVNPSARDTATFTCGPNILGMAFLNIRAGAPLDFKIASTQIMRVSDTTQSLLVTPFSSAVKGVVIKGASSQTATLEEWQNSSAAVLGSVSAAGLAKFIAGTSTSYAKVGGSITTNVTQVANSGSTETDLKTTTINGGTMATAGDAVAFVAFGNVANNANNKRLRAYFGSTLLLDTGVFTTAAVNWCIKGTITRINATGQWAGAEVIVGTTNTINMVFVAETLANNLTLRITGTGVSDSDINSFFWIVNWIPTGV